MRLNFGWQPVWDDEKYGASTPTQSLSYAMGRTRFLYKTVRAEGDPFIQLLFDLSRENSSASEQIAFIKGLEYVEYQDICAAQRMQQLRRHRKIRRKINGTKVTMRNWKEWTNFYDRKCTNPCDNALTKGFYELALAVNKRDKVISSSYPAVEPFLSTTPYLRHVIWFVALLVMNEFTPNDVNLVYDLMSFHVMIEDI